MGEQALEELVPNDPTAGGRPALETVPCPSCGRRFLPERLAKHMSICKKTAKKKRQPFNSKAQRLLEGDAVPPNTPNSGTGSDSTSRSTRTRVTGRTVAKGVTSVNSDSDSGSSKKTNWRAQHEEFLKTVRAARGVKVDEEEPSGPVETRADGSVVQQKKVPPGYVTCPTCDRNFSRGAADRHIPWCADKAKLVKVQAAGPGPDDAMARFKARSKYKAPTIRRGSKESALGSAVSLSKPVKAVVEPKKPPPAPVKSKVVKPVVRSTSRSRLDEKKSTTVSSRTQSVSPKRKPKPVVNVAPSRVKQLLQANEANKATPKTPIIKFKDKFPDRKVHVSGVSSKYFQETAQLQELLKRPDTMSQFPRTVPGMRTGGMTPTMGASTSSTSINELPADESLTTRLRSRLEDMYLQTSAVTGNGLPANGFSGDPQSPPGRGSTSGSST
ncbi:Zinc finger C2HC domain-containing protein 1A [Halotydeus destructor]|nr:Zinc finger C2HC domain-containing protein 1A [Halotydeus destructor]